MSAEKKEAAKNFKDEDYANLKPGTKWGWLTVIGCGFMIAFTLQTIMSGAGNFFGPVTTELGFTIAQFAWWLTMYSIGMCVAMLGWAGRIWPKVSTPVLTTVCCVIAIGMNMAMGLFNALWQWIVAGLIIGAAGGTIFMLAAPILCTNWFSKIPGTAMGVAGVVGAIIFAIMSPIDASIVTNLGWRQAYFVIGLISLIGTLPWTIFVFRYSPRDRGCRPVGWEPGQKENVAAAKNAPGLTGKEALKTLAFWGVFVGTGVCSLFGGFQGFYVTIAGEWGYTAVLGALLLSASTISGALGPVWGIMADKLGAFRTTMIAMIITLLACICLYFIHAPYWVVFMLVFFFAFMNPVVGQLGPLMMHEAFGPKEYTKIVGWLQIGFGTIGAFSSPLLGSSMALFGNWTGTFIIGIFLAVITIICYVLAILGSKKIHWKEEDDGEIAAA